MKYYIKVALQHYAMGLIIPVSIAWKLQNGLSLPEAILTEAITLLATTLADLPAGVIANKINNKRSLLIGAVLHLASVALLVLGSSFIVFTAAAILMGIAWAFVSGADEAYIHDDFIERKEEYKKVFATSTMVDESATIVGMLSASLLLYFQVSLRGLFLAASCVLLIHLVYTFLFLPKGQRLPPLHPVRAANLLSFEALKNKHIASLALLMLAFGVVYEAARPLWQPHMQQIGIDIVNFGIIFALLKFASLGGSIVARYYEFHTKYVIAVFVIMLGTLLSFGAPIKIISIAALCVYLFTENYFRVYMSTVLNERIHANRAAILSLGSVLRNGVGALIVAGTGLLSGVSIFLALLCVVVIKVPAMVYILKLHRGNK
jgi:DHA3 family tetracycline resistance protein-like MFS transporter